MEPMKPMKPMAPLKPMEPMSKWWPDDLGHPATVGSQNGLRYAFFPDKQRLLLERDGKCTQYDTGDHHISGVSQQASTRQDLVFTSQNGVVKLDELKKLD
jgi:hypothetical protein